MISDSNTPKPDDGSSEDVYVNCLSSPTYIDVLINFKVTLYNLNTSILIEFKDKFVQRSAVMNRHVAWYYKSGIFV